MTDIERLANEIAALRDQQTEMVQALNGLVEIIAELVSDDDEGEAATDDAAAALYAAYRARQRGGN